VLIRFLRSLLGGFPVDVFDKARLNPKLPSLVLDKQMACWQVLEYLTHRQQRPDVLATVNPDFDGVPLARHVAGGVSWGRRRVGDASSQ
jgi:hypothetical protein